jgi:hypothetical protein
MTNNPEDKIQRWRNRIEECHVEARSQTPAGREALLSIIGSYERLISIWERAKQKQSD